MSELTPFPMTAAAVMTTADWELRNPLLDQFQLGRESDGLKGMKIGDGVTRWNDLEYLNATSVAFIEALTTQTPTSDDLFAFVAVTTSRVVRITALGQGTLTKYLRVRASAGGAILATGTVSAATSSSTIINRGAGTAAQYVEQIDGWLSASSGANLTAIGGATASYVNDTVTITYPTGTAYNEQVWETDDSQLSITELTESGDPCDVRVTGIGAGDYQYTGTYGGKPVYNTTGVDPLLSSCVWEGVWNLYDDIGNTVNVSNDDTTYPYQATWVGSVVTAIPAGADAVLRKVPKAEMGVVCVLDSVTVDLNTTDLQLSQVVVPTGKVCVVTGEIVRNASVDLTTMPGDLFTGWDATDANDLWATLDQYNFRNEQLAVLTNATKATGRSSLYPRDAESGLAIDDNAQFLIGTAGQTLGFKCDDVFGSAATVTVDVLGYFV